jgi:hypothetical protein
VVSGCVPLKTASAVPLLSLLLLLSPAVVSFSPEVEVSLFPHDTMVKIAIAKIAVDRYLKETFKYFIFIVFRLLAEVKVSAKTLPLLLSRCLNV